MAANAVYKKETFSLSFVISKERFGKQSLTLPIKTINPRKISYITVIKVKMNYRYLPNKPNIPIISSKTFS